MFSAEICEIFKNTLVIASESFRNDFAEQMFNLQLSKSLSSGQFWKKLLFSYREKNDALKDALKERCAGNEVGN